MAGQGPSPQDLAKLKDDFVLSRDTVHLVQPIARFIATPDEEWILDQNKQREINGEEMNEGLGSG